MGKVQQPSPFISGINLIKNSSKSKLFHQPNDKTIRIFSLALVLLVTIVKRHTKFKDPKDQINANTKYK
jgi:hypothetical protein